MKQALTLTLILLLMPLAGCLGNASDEAGATNPTVRVLTYDISAFTVETLDEFTNQTGYEVEMIRADDAGGILETMLQTRQAPQADVMVGLDNTYLQTAIEADLLGAHQLTNLTLDNAAQGPYIGPLALPFDQGDVCLNVDERGLNDNRTMPTSLWNLTQPEWNGKVAIPSPLTSSPGRSFMTATVDYFEHDVDNATDAFDWWSAMANNDMIVTSGWTEAYEIHYSGGYGPYVDSHIGDALMTVSYCHSPGVEAFYADNYTVSTSVVLDRATFHQVEYAGVINGADNVEGAKAFISYLLSEDVNRNMPENNLMNSVLPNPVFPETNGYRHHTDVPSLNAEISMERIAEDMDGWLEAWRTATA